MPPRSTDPTEHLPSNKKTSNTPSPHRRRFMRQEGPQHSARSRKARAWPQPLFLSPRRVPLTVINAAQHRTSKTVGADFSSLGQGGRVRRTSGATWRGGTVARLTDARTDAPSWDRRAPRQGAGQQERSPSPRLLLFSPHPPPIGSPCILQEFYCG